MKTHLEVTQQELEAMKRHHRLTEYTNQDSIELVNLVRTYINPHAPSCTSCHSNLRDAKNALNSFYLENKDAIEVRLLKETSAPIEVEDVIVEQPKIKSKKK